MATQECRQCQKVKDYSEFGAMDKYHGRPHLVVCQECLKRMDDEAAARGEHSPYCTCGGCIPIYQDD